MDIVYLNNLSAEEKELVFNAPALVAYLIGGVDNNFDEKEIEQAKHVVNLRSTVGDALLLDYFSAVNKNFDAKLLALIQKYENLEAETRTEILVEELTTLNEILKKLDSLYTKTLVASLRSYAKEIAEASGGIFGMLDVSYEEEHLIGLEMLTINED